MPFVSIAAARDNGKNCASEVADSTPSNFPDRQFTIQPTSQLKDHLRFVADTGNTPSRQSFPSCAGRAEQDGVARSTNVSAATMY
jgi:hypothetical protein